jgi:endonuclease III
LAFMTKKRSEKIIAKLLNFYGHPKPALMYRNLYELAVSVVLSAQTTDVQVNRVTPGLFKNFKDFKSLSGAAQEDIEKIIKSTGFYRNKTKNIIGLSKTVMEKFNGVLPETRELLMELPGIGRKSANVILSMGFNIPAFAVDTHVLRVANRLGFCNSEDPAVVEESLISTIPQSDWITGHLLFITHGRKICTARNPSHEKCPVNALCDAVKNNL